jgi:hypothetical protein
MGHDAPLQTSAAAAEGRGLRDCADDGLGTGVTENNGERVRRSPLVNFVGGARRGWVLNKHIIDGKITKVTIGSRNWLYGGNIVNLAAAVDGAAATAEVAAALTRTVTDGGTATTLRVKLFASVPCRCRVVIRTIPLTAVTMTWRPGTGYRVCQRCHQRRGSCRGNCGARNAGLGRRYDQGTDGRTVAGTANRSPHHDVSCLPVDRRGRHQLRTAQVAAHYMAYLMLRQFGAVRKTNPDAWRSVLQSRESDRSRRGCRRRGKVPPGPLSSWASNDAAAGADVYIDDGRAGGYRYAPSIGRPRRFGTAGADGLRVTTALGQTNFAYEDQEPRHSRSPTTSS